LRHSRKCKRAASPAISAEPQIGCFSFVKS